MELKIDNLTKRYADKTALDHISCSLTPGITGLLGANGAGKSTLMRMICGVMKPTSGSITLDQYDVAKKEYRNLIGYLPQDFGYYPEFTGLEFLLYVAALKGLDKQSAKTRGLELLEQVNLEGAAEKKIKTYSGGMKRRLGIPENMGLLSKIWSYLPGAYIGSWTFTEYRLISVFGQYFNNLQAAPVLWLLASALFVVAAKVAYQRYQVQGK